MQSSWDLHMILASLRCGISVLKHVTCDTGIPLADNMFVPLSAPMEVWHFDMLAPPDESDRKTLDVTFTRSVRQLARPTCGNTVCAVYAVCAVERCRRLQGSWKLALPVSLLVATHAAL